MRRGLIGLLILILVGVAMATYVVTTIESTTRIEEPITVTELKEFEESMYPGETSTWTFRVDNAANIPYTITFMLTAFDDADTDDPNDGKGADISRFVVDHEDLTSDLLDDGKATATVSPGQSITGSLTIKTAKDSRPGTVTVRISIARG